MSDPLKPVEVGGYDTSGYVRRLDVSGGYAFLADREGGLRVLDVSNPASPKRAYMYQMPTVDQVPYVCDVKVVGNHAFLAHYREGLKAIDLTPLGFTTSYAITASAGTGGSISPSGQVVVKAGSSQRFTITPEASHTVSDVQVDGASMGPVPEYTFQNVSANHVITASFTETKTPTTPMVTPAVNLLLHKND